MSGWIETGRIRIEGAQLSFQSKIRPCLCLYTTNLNSQEALAANLDGQALVHVPLTDRSDSGRRGDPHD